MDFWTSGRGPRQPDPGKPYPTGTCRSGGESWPDDLSARGRADWWGRYVTHTLCYGFLTYNQRPHLHLRFKLCDLITSDCESVSTLAPEQRGLAPSLSTMFKEVIRSAYVGSDMIGTSTVTIWETCSDCTAGGNVNRRANSTEWPDWEIGDSCLLRSIQRPYSLQVPRLGQTSSAPNFLAIFTSAALRQIRRRSQGA